MNCRLLAPPLLYSLCLTLLLLPEVRGQEASLPIATDRQLFVDEAIIQSLHGQAMRRLHEPQSTGKVLGFDQPWEGVYSGYITVFPDGDRLRMYYRGLPIARHSLETEVTCYAESQDGIHWEKPELGLFEVHGTRDNNVVLARHRGCHNFAPFKDRNPNAKDNARYKALGGTGKPGLIAFASPDGIHWNEIQSEPVITDGAFDSQNVAFWSEAESQYVCYFRVFRKGVRWIARTTSADFVHWSTPVDLDFGDEPPQHLYTNQLAPYFRAPHLYLGMPTRFFPGRRALTKEQLAELGTPAEWNYGNDCADIILISTRGGSHLNRSIMDAFVRPGLDARNWTSRANYAAHGIVPIDENLMGFYISHNLGYPSARVERYVLRKDGFVSVFAPYSGGELITRPVVFSGSKLEINYSTSAAGSVTVELQDDEGHALDGFALADCPEIIGDQVRRIVHWQSGHSLEKFAGRPVRLRFRLKDADLYSFKFQ